MSLLKDKNIVIIGGTTGIGLSAAKAFVINGAKVMVVGRNEEHSFRLQKIYWEKMLKLFAGMQQK